MGWWEWLARWRSPPAPDPEVELAEDEDAGDEDGVDPEVGGRLVQHALVRPVVALCLEPDKGFFVAWIETVAPEYLEYRVLDERTGHAGPLHLVPLAHVHEVCLDSLEVQRAWLAVNLRVPFEGEEDT